MDYESSICVIFKADGQSHKDSHKTLDANAETKNTTITIMTAKMTTATTKINNTTEIVGYASF